MEFCHLPSKVLYSDSAEVQKSSVRSVTGQAEMTASAMTLPAENKKDMEVQVWK